MKCLRRSRIARTSESNIVVVHQPVDSLDFTTNIKVVRLVVKVFDSRVLLVTTKDLPRLLFPVTCQLKSLHKVMLCGLLVWLVDIINSDDGEVAVVTEIAKGDASAGLDSLRVNHVLCDV